MTNATPAPAAPKGGVRLKNLEGVTAKDAFSIDPRLIIAPEGWNARLPGPSLDAHIAMLAESIRESGVRNPISVKYKNGEITVTDGFCRLAAVMKLIAEGVEIRTVPAIAEDSKSNEADHVVGMIIKNSGKPLEPVEVAQVYKRLTGYGWTTKEIAAKTGVTEGYVEKLMSLNGAHPEVLTSVKAGELSASAAIDLTRQEGDNAPQALKEAKAKANAEGKTRVTPKHFGSARPKWAKVGPALRTHLLTVTKAADEAQDLASVKALLKEALAFIQETCPQEPEGEPEAAIEAPGLFTQEPTAMIA